MLSSCRPMLCHTQCNHSPAWSAQWPGTASEVSLSPPHYKWATTRIRLRASLHCVLSTLMYFLKERCESHHSPRNFVDSSTGRGLFPILMFGGLWTLDRGAVKCMTQHLWVANLKPFLVAHSCIALTACCRCLSMVSRERPRKPINRSSTNKALKTSLAIQESSSLMFSPKHVTAKTPPVGTPSSGYLNCNAINVPFMEVLLIVQVVSRPKSVQHLYRTTNRQSCR